MPAAAGSTALGGGSSSRPHWFISDAVHYTWAGYAIRARAIADALATAFPLGGQSSGCVVS